MLPVHHVSKRLLSLVALTVLLLIATATGIRAHDANVGDLTIVHAYARASAGPAKVGVVFLNIRNSGDTADQLVNIVVGPDIAKKAALHTHIMEGDIAKMRRVDGGIAIPVQGTVMMQPGGLHIMLMGLKAPLIEGDSFMITLTFERAGEISLEVRVLGVSAGTEMEGLHMGATEAMEMTLIGSSDVN